MKRINIDKVIVLRQEGKTIQEIADILGNSKAGIFHQLRKAQNKNLVERRFRERQAEGHLNVEEIERMRRDGKTIYEIAEEMKCSPGAVHYHASQMADSDSIVAKGKLKRIESVLKGAPVGRENRIRNNIAKRKVEFDRGSEEETVDNDIFVAGLYLGEGGKTNRFRLSNSNPDAIKITIDFLVKRGVATEYIQLYIQTHKNSVSDEETKRFWHGKCLIDDIRIYRKASTISKTKRRLPFGVATIITKGEYGWKAFEWIYGIMSRFTQVQRKGYKGDGKLCWQCNSP